MGNLNEGRFEWECECERDQRETGVGYILMILTLEKLDPKAQTGVEYLVRNIS
jgi:hypothetical protein